MGKGAKGKAARLSVIRDQKPIEYNMKTDAHDSAGK